MKTNKYLIYFAVLLLISAGALTPPLISAQTLFDEIRIEAFQDIKVPMYIIDPEKEEIVDANPEAAEFYGYPLTTMRGMPLTVLSTMRSEILADELRSAVSGEKNYFILKHRKASGVIIDVEIYTSPVTVKGRVYLFSMVHDITAKVRIEKQLVESQSRLLTAESFAKYGHWIFNLSSNIVEASEGARALYGIGSKIWSIREVQTIPLPEYREMLDSALKDLITKGKPYNVSFKIKRPADGKIIDIQSTARYNPENNTVFGIIQDVTEQTEATELLKKSSLTYIFTLLIILFIQLIIIVFYINAVRLRKKAQLSLQKKSEEFDSFFSITTDILCIIDMKGCFIRVNDACKSILGYEREEVENRNVFDFIHPDDIEGTESELKKLSGKKKVFNFINRYRKKTGGFCSLEWQATPEDDYVYAVARDVTERIKTDNMIKKQEKLLSKIFEVIPVGLWITDETGKLVYGNPMGVEIWGAEPHVSIDEYGVFKARRYPSGEEIKPEDWALAHTVREGAAIQNEILEIDTFDGKKKIIINHTAPVKDEDGNLLSAIVVNQDITDLKKAEEERIAFEKQIQQTQKLESLGVLAGGIAHDFNNILMAVLGHAELALLELSTSSPARRNIMEIENAAKKAAELSGQMLAYTGRASFVQEEIDVIALVEEMTHLLKTLITKKAILNLRLEKELPHITADPGQITQIIMNLIINSSDAVGDRSGVITISVGATRCDEEYLKKTDLYNELVPGLYIHIEVSDTGIGMTAKEIEKIFDPFYTTKFAGRGLGLAAVLGIVKAHKGAIKVYSEPGKGTTVKVLFPALESADEKSAAEKALNNEKNWKGSGTVLFVDDEESLRAVGGSMLERMGFDVIMAEDGREAVEIYKQRKDEIDLVILDLTMPHLDGSQAFTELRKINEEIRVIIASGYNQDDVGARFAGKSLLGIIQKPYTMDKLRSLLKMLP